MVEDNIFNHPVYIINCKNHRFNYYKIPILRSQQGSSANCNGEVPIPLLLPFPSPLGPFPLSLTASPVPYSLLSSPSLLLYPSSPTLFPPPLYFPPPSHFPSSFPFSTSLPILLLSCPAPCFPRPFLFPLPPTFCFISSLSCSIFPDLFLLSFRSPGHHLCPARGFRGCFWAD